MNQRTEDMLVKGVGTLAAVAAAWLAQKAISAVWRQFMGHDVPTGTEDNENKMSELVAAAVVTGAIGTVVRMLAARGGTKVARKALVR